MRFRQLGQSDRRPCPAHALRPAAVLDRSTTSPAPMQPGGSAVPPEPLLDPRKPRNPTALKNAVLRQSSSAPGPSVLRARCRNPCCCCRIGHCSLGAAARAVQPPGARPVRSQRSHRWPHRWAEPSPSSHSLARPQELHSSVAAPRSRLAYGREAMRALAGLPTPRRRPCPPLTAHHRLAWASRTPAADDWLQAVRLQHKNRGSLSERQAFRPPPPRH